jgi:type IV pilus assembly protein PilM
VICETQNENVALIDIGASKTSLNILKGTSSVFMRDVALGCMQINQKIMSLSDCSYEQAELIKLGESSNKISAEELKEIVTTVVSDWCTEIRRALDFFYANYPDDKIKRIILSGGGANIEEFRQLLASNAATAVETLNPLKKLRVDEKAFDPEFIRQIAPQSAIAMGLALRKVDDK